MSFIKISRRSTYYDRCCRLLLRLSLRWRESNKQVRNKWTKKVWRNFFFSLKHLSETSEASEDGSGTLAWTSERRCWIIRFSFQFSRLSKSKPYRFGFKFFLIELLDRRFLTFAFLRMSFFIERAETCHDEKYEIEMPDCPNCLADSRPEMVVAILNYY